MTRETVKQLLPIIKAYAEGKEIEIFDKTKRMWITAILPHFNCVPNLYRIKPEPKYRPFKDEKECWTEMQKHQPVGWVKQINGKGIEVCIHCGVIKGDWILTAVDEVSFPFDWMYNNYTFVDGTPFGIKEEE